MATAAQAAASLVEQTSSIVLVLTWLTPGRNVVYAVENRVPDMPTPLATRVKVRRTLSKGYTAHVWNALTGSATRRDLGWDAMEVHTAALALLGYLPSQVELKCGRRVQDTLFSWKMPEGQVGWNIFGGVVY